jgi:hypothetical protein
MTTLEIESSMPNMPSKHNKLNEAGRLLIVGAPAARNLHKSVHIKYIEGN